MLPWQPLSRGINTDATVSSNMHVVVPVFAYYAYGMNTDTIASDS